MGAERAPIVVIGVVVGPVVGVVAAVCGAVVGPVVKVRGAVVGAVAAVGGLVAGDRVLATMKKGKEEGTKRESRVLHLRWPSSRALGCGGRAGAVA